MATYKVLEFKGGVVRTFNMMVHKNIIHKIEQVHVSSDFKIFSAKNVDLKCIVEKCTLNAKLKTTNPQ